MISVYGPLLGLDGMGYQTQQQQSTLDPRLRQLLLQVQAGLGNVVKQGVSQVSKRTVQSCATAALPAQPIKHSCECLLKQELVSLHTTAVGQI